ncbi:MAG: AAA family ATPase [Myxococcota bacterium]
MRKIHFSVFEFDLDSMSLFKNGTPLAIGKRTCDSLLYLIQNRGRFVSRKELHRKVWSSEKISASTIPTCILEIRKLLCTDNGDTELIESKRHLGYRFTGTALFTTPHNPSSSADKELPFVGRHSLINTLHRTIQETVSNLQGRMITIIGEAGSGKTRIINELAKQTTGRADIIISRAVSSDADLPFSMWTTALRAALRRDQKNRALAAASERILNILPDISAAGSCSPKEPAINNRTFLAEWTNAFRSLAALRPLILVLEDIHNADSDSLLLLDRISCEVDNTPIILIATMRPPISERKHASAIARILGSSSSLLLPIPPLSANEIEDLLDPFLSKRAETAQQVFSKSSGNAFYATFLCQLIAENADPDKILKDAANPNASEVVSRQLYDLPDSCKEILKYASVCGVNFSHIVISKALGLSATTVMELLTPAVESRAVAYDDGEYSFRHSILRDSLYSSIRPTKRLSIHEQIAAALESAPESHTSPMAIFDHLCRAYPLASLDRINNAAFIAAEEATSRFAHNEAARILGTLLKIAKNDMTLTSSMHCKILIGLASSALYAGNQAGSRKMLLDAAKLARREQLAEQLALCGLNLAPDFLSIEVGTYDSELVMILRESLDLLPEGATSLKSQVLARLSQALRWKCDNRGQIEEYANQAVELADRSNDPTARLASLAALADAASGPDLTDERIRRTLMLQDRALSNGDRYCYLVQQTRLIAALLEKGDLRGVARENDRYREIADSTGLPQYRWYPVSTDSMLACLSGQIELAEQYAQDYAKIAGEEPDENFKQTYACQFILRQIESNQSSQILSLAQSFAGSHQSVLSWAAAVAWIQWDCGDFNAARESLRQFSESDILTLYREPGGTIGLAALAETTAYVGDRRRASILYELLTPICDRFATAGYGVAYFGSLERYASVLARSLGLTSQAVRHAKNAVLEETRLGAPGWRLLAMMEFNRSVEREHHASKKARKKITFPREIELARAHRVYLQNYLEGD